MLDLGFLHKLKIEDSGEIERVEAGISDDRVVIKR